MTNKNNRNEYSLDTFLNTAKACGLNPEGSYQEKLYTYVANMLDRNRLLYEIDVSDAEPMSMVDCIVKDKK